jgi:hypothetical protein
VYSCLQECVTQLNTFSSGERTELHQLQECVTQLNTFSSGERTELHQLQECVTQLNTFSSGERTELHQLRSARSPHQPIAQCTCPSQVQASHDLHFVVSSDVTSNGDGVQMRRRTNTGMADRRSKALSIRFPSEEDLLSGMAGE